MEWQGWFTLGILALAIVAMAREMAGPDVILTGALFVLGAAGHPDSGGNLRRIRQPIDGDDRRPLHPRRGVA